MTCEGNQKNLQYHDLLLELPQVSLQKPGSREGFPTRVTLVVEAVGEHVHREGGHADVHLAADAALLSRARGQAQVRLFVSKSGSIP